MEKIKVEMTVWGKKCIDGKKKVWIKDGERQRLKDWMEIKKKIC